MTRCSAASGGGVAEGSAAVPPHREPTNREPTPRELRELWARGAGCVVTANIGNIRGRCGVAMRRAPCGRPPVNFVKFGGWWQRDLGQTFA